MRAGHILKTAFVIVLCLAAGFALTAYGPAAWDDMYHYCYSQWLVYQFGLGGAAGACPTEMTMYAPLWELILGIMTTFPFAWLDDPFWVRHGFTCALGLAGLCAIYAMLRRAGISRAGSMFVLAGIFGLIRIGGHALFNTKDFPGAVAYLLTGVAGWILMQETRKRGFPSSWLALLGALAALPFLVRSPLLLYLPLFCAALLYYAYRDRAGIARTTLALLIPVTVCILLIVTISPAFWHWGLGQVSRIAEFRSMPTWDGAVRAFGMSWDSRNLPWWYPFLWIPLSTHPIGLIAAASGVACGVIRRWRRLSVSGLTQWMWIVTFATWLSFLVIHPKVYDEDRHILFLFPPLFLVCFLELETWLRDRWKDAFAGLLLLASFGAYWSWGTYAYIYRNPLIAPQEPDAFLGDYWGTCMSKAAVEFEHRIPRGSTIYAQTPVAQIMSMRLGQSILFRRSAYTGYRFVYEPPADGGYIAVTYNRLGIDRDIIAAADMILWQNVTPNGERACTISVIR